MADEPGRHLGTHALEHLDRTDEMAAQPRQQRPASRLDGRLADTAEHAEEHEQVVGVDELGAAEIAHAVGNQELLVETVAGDEARVEMLVAVQPLAVAQRERRRDPGIERVVGAQVVDARGRRQVPALQRIAQQALGPRDAHDLHAARLERVGDAPERVGPGLHAAGRLVQASHQVIECRRADRHAPLAGTDDARPCRHARSPLARLAARRGNHNRRALPSLERMMTRDFRSFRVQMTDAQTQLLPQSRYSRRHRPGRPDRVRRAGRPPTSRGDRSARGWARRRRPTPRPAHARTRAGSAASAAGRRPWRPRRAARSPRPAAAGRG